VTDIDVGGYDATLRSGERRAIVLGTVFRAAGTPVVALIGLLNTAIIVRETGEAVFGLVSLVTTLSLLLPFTDLGIGAVITNACSRPGRIVDDAAAVATVQRGMRTLAFVAALLIAVSLLIMAMNSWGWLLGTTSGNADRFAITVAACLIALGVPAGMGLRILLALDMNPLAVLLSMSNVVFALSITLALRMVGAPGIWYAVSGTAGALIGSCIATAVALRVSGLGWSAFAEPAAEYAKSKLFQGSLWMFVASVSIPLGYQSQRLVLSHVSSPAELSKYSLMGQVYALAWMLFSTAGMALWPVFVKRRPDQRATIKLWLRATAAFGVLSSLVGVGMILLGPWATAVLSNGELTASRRLAVAFAALLVVQCVQLPAGVLLTTPREARFQAIWITSMGLTSVALGVWWGRTWGGVGVAAAATIAVVVMLIVPYFTWIPRLLRHRQLDLV
jgi:O-antigen/teichoic acid export membrane protein